MINKSFNLQFLRYLDLIEAGNFLKWMSLSVKILILRLYIVASLEIYIL